MTDFINHILNDELANQVWFSKYALHNREGKLLETSPLERFTTIADEIIRVDKKYTNNKEDKQFEIDLRESLYNGVLLPGGSNLFGIGNNYSKSSLSNCFVIDGRGEDSYGSILRNDEEIVQISKRRGGVGLDISHLRPAGFNVQNASRTSTGSISFMPRF